MTIKDPTTIKDLESQIAFYAQKYYEGSPSISDEEFDELVDKLRELNPSSEVLTQVGWGFDVERTEGKKSPHKYSLIGSLPKYKTIESLPSEYRDISRHGVVISAKLDGLSSVVYFTNGKVDKVLTRGSGTVGTDITDKWRYISKLRNIPDEIEGFTGAIRGELVVSNDDYEILKSKYPDLKNPRNYAAGLLNRSDISVDLQYVSWIPYNIIASNIPYESQIDVLKALYSIYNESLDCVETYNTLDQDYLKEIYDTFNMNYPCDGVVLTIPHLDTDEIYEDGASSIHYSQIAYKFKTEVVQTTVDHVEWNLSRLGTLVPVVVFDPIELCGATVKRATGFNAAYIRDNSIGKGSVISVERSNEVIPDIQEVVTPTTPDIPEVCPECGHPLSWKGVNLVCENEECPSMKSMLLLSWIAWLGTPETYDGVGSKIIQKYLDENNISSIDDLMRPDYTEKQLSGAQMSRVSQLVNEVRTNPVTIDVALRALNIPGLGSNRCKTISQNPEICELLLKEYDNLSDDTEQKLANLIGPAVAHNIRQYSSRLSNLKYVVSRIITKDSASVESKGTVAITGKLSMKRSEFEKILADHGYSVGGITKDTKFLITDNPNSGSSKNRKADQLGIPKVTEEEFTSTYLADTSVV